MNETGVLNLSESYEYIEGCDNCIMLDDGMIYDPNASTEITLYPWYHYIHNCVNLGLFILLVAGLILGPCLIYRKHKGEKGLWKKIVKWDLIFFFIMVAFRFIVSLILRFFQPQGAVISS